jgi:hypothetical protein
MPLGTRPLPDEGVIVFNIEAMRPACVILGAFYGGTSEYHNLFPSDTWIVDGPLMEGLKAYRITRAQAEKLVERVSA